MLRPLESDEAQRQLVASSRAAANEPIVPPVAREEFDASLLPRDHPKWVKDALTVSARTREAIARMRPVAVRIFGFWDHRVRERVVGGLRVCIDASGSYRLR